MTTDEQTQYDLLLRYITKYPTFGDTSIRIGILTGMLPLISNLINMQNRMATREYLETRAMQSVLEQELEEVAQMSDAERTG
jgi:hypothetical protein